MSNPLSSDDPEVWSRLVDAANPAAMMVALARRLGPELARHLTPEDVLQEALLKAWRARHEVEWQGLPSFRRWLLRIAERCIEDQRDGARAVKRGVEARSITLRAPSGSDSTDGPRDFEPWSSTTPSRLAQEREMMTLMETALAGLPEELREIVRLRLFDDLLIEEIAARTGLGESAVRHRFRKGAELYRRLLRAALGVSDLPAVRAQDGEASAPRETT